MKFPPGINETKPKIMRKLNYVNSSTGYAPLSFKGIKLVSWWFALLSYKNLFKITMFWVALKLEVKLNKVLDRN